MFDVYACGSFIANVLPYDSVPTIVFKAYVPGPGTYNLPVLAVILVEVPNPNEGAAKSTAFLASCLYALGAGDFSAPGILMLYLYSVPILAEILA